MKKSLLLGIGLVGVFAAASAQQVSQAYLDYINKYADAAIREQARYGIPASITLAQGLLESQAGQSELAVQANNHFGIKCHKDWTGGTYYYDDDAKNECFRVYSSVGESFEDHSKFLREKPRYADLFLMDPTNYEGWAIGLRRDGYATDPNYSDKLIKLIKDYDLHRFDLAKAASAKEEATATKSTKNGNLKLLKTPEGRANAKSGLKSAMKGNEAAPKTTSSTTEEKKATASIGRSGREIQSSYATEDDMKSAKRYNTHDVKRVNGVRCVVAREGDTYGQIAEEFHQTLEKILANNDVKSDALVAEGTNVFLGRKRNMTGSRDPKVIVVDDGQSAHSISQAYGIRLQSLYDMNDMPYEAGVKYGQRLVLRTRK